MLHGSASRARASLAPHVIDTVFDPHWYVWRHPHCGGPDRALDHYLDRGVARAARCSPFIDTTALEKCVGKPVEPLAFLSEHSLDWPGVTKGFEDLHHRQESFLNSISVEWLTRPSASGGRRPYLVLLQCGDPVSAQALDRAERTYDLWVNYYAIDRATAAIGDIVTAQRGTKFTAIQTLFSDPATLTPYSYVMLLDDDIAISPVCIEYLFRLASYFSVAMCQASLSATSHGVWRAFFSQSRYVRFVNGIEIMMPVLARPLLDHLLANGPISISGYGLDIYWASEVGFGQKGDVLVFDAVIADHHRPISKEDGAYYTMLRENGIFWEAEFWDILCNRVGRNRWRAFSEM